MSEEEFHGINPEVLERLNSAPEVHRLVKDINDTIQQFEDVRYLPDIICGVQVRGNNITTYRTKISDTPNIAGVNVTTLGISNNYFWKELSDLLPNLKDDVQLLVLQEIAEKLARKCRKQLLLLNIIHEYSVLLASVKPLWGSSMKYHFYEERNSWPPEIGKSYISYKWGDIHKSLPFTMNFLKTLKLVLTEE